jgi:DNA-binding NarL/FixJ family response regulator
MKEKIKLAIVEDNLAYRKFLVKHFSKRQDVEIISEASNGKECIDGLEIQIPGIILLDLGMPVMSGTETVAYLDKNHPEIKILILTVHKEDAILLELIETGVRGFLSKDMEIKEIIKAVYMAHKNHYFLEGLNLKKIVTANKNTHLNNIKFTDRESEIIKLLCEGFAPKEIANKLFLSTRTVETHIYNVRQKTKTRTLRKLVTLLTNQSN